MIETVTRLTELEEHIKKSGLGFRDAILDYYKKLGETLGFEVRVNAPLIMHGVNLGNIDLMWVQPNVVFFCEFGAFDEVLKHLWKIAELQPELAVLVLSSNSRCKPEKVAELIRKSGLTENIRNRTLVLDIERRKIMHSPKP